MKKAHILLPFAVALFTFAGIAQGQVISQNMKSLARSGTALVGLSGADGTLKRSTDGGASFSTVFTPSGATLQNVVASGTTVIAVGNSGYIVRSTDSGATFTALTTTDAPATLGSLYDAATSNGTLWVAVGKSATNRVAAAYSTNGGASWTSAATPANFGELRAVVYDAGAARWSAVGTDTFGGAALYTSTDAQNWTQVTAPTSASTINDIAANGAGNLLAVGDSGTLLVSSNGGSSWAFEANTGAVSQNLYAVVYSSASTSFTAGGQELVQITYTVAGGSVVAQAPIASGGDITTLITSAAGAVITGGGLAGYQTITFAGPGDQLMTASPVTLSATASSGLTVSFRVISGSASISGTQLTLTGAGAVTIEAYQDGGTTGGITYTPAVSVQRTINVTQATATVTLGSLSATFDGSAKSATASTTPAGLAVVITYNDGRTTAPTDAGSHTVVATINETAYTGSASGTLVIAKADQTITFAGPGDQTLGGSPIALIGSSSPPWNLPLTYTLDSGPATLTGNTLTLTGTGTVTVTASQGGNANINAATSVTRSFIVTAPTATVTLGSLTATYDGTPKAATATTEPGDLIVTFTYDNLSTAPTNVGSYTVVGTVVDTTYAGSASGTLVIAKANQTITFNAPADREFSTATINLSATAGSGLPVSFAVLSGPASVDGTTLTLTGAGTVNLQATQGGDANYNAAPSVNRSFTVTPNFESWRRANFNSGELADSNISGPNAIVSGDGLTNLLKYALGLDPHVAVSSGLPEGSSTATDWVFTYTRPTSTTDLTYEVESTTDFATWSTVVPLLASTDGGTSTWSATVTKASAPTKLFFRLKVTRNLAP